MNSLGFSSIFPDVPRCWKLSWNLSEICYIILYFTIIFCILYYIIYYITHRTGAEKHDAMMQNTLEDELKRHFCDYEVWRYPNLTEGWVVVVAAYKLYYIPLHYIILNYIKLYYIILNYVVVVHMCTIYIDFWTVPRMKMMCSWESN